MSSTAKTLDIANEQTATMSLLTGDGSKAGASLAHRSWKHYPYVENFVRYHSSYLNTYALNTNSDKPTHVFPVAVEVDEIVTNSSSDAGSNNRRLLTDCGGTLQAGKACRDTTANNVVFVYDCTRYPEVCDNTICGMTYNVGNSLKNGYGLYSGLDVITASKKWSGFSFQSGSSADRRRQSLPRELSTESGKDRDEVPMASWSIGGCNARLQAVNPSQNRIHGSNFGGQVRAYGGKQANAVPLIIDLGTYSNAKLGEATCCKSDYGFDDRYLIQKNKCSPDPIAKKLIYPGIAGKCP